MAILPEDVRNYILQFVSPSTYYLIKMYIPSFGTIDKKFKKDEIINDMISTDNVILCEFFDNISSFRFDPCLLSAKMNKSHILKWAITIVISIDSDVPCYMAQYGNLEMIKYLKDNVDYENWHYGVFVKAARYGHLDILQYLYEQDCNQCGEYRIMQAAAKHGNLDNVIWLYKNGFEMGRYVIEAAAEYGHLNIVKYLHEHGCSYNYLTLEEAAYNDHWDIVEYLILSEFPIDDATIIYIRSSNYAHLLNIVSLNRV